MVGNDVTTYVMQPINDSIMVIMDLIPKIIGAVIILLIGWIVGRVLGKVVKLFIEKVGVEAALSKTIVGKTFLNSGMSVGTAADYLVRIVVYLLAIMSAAEILNIYNLSEIMQGIVSYIPNIVGFILIIVIGLILVDYFADFIETYGKTASIALISPVVIILRLLFYLVVLIMALTTLRLDVTIIYVFIQPLAWGIGLGVGVAIALFFGLGLKDRAPEMVDSFLDSMDRK
ncbi:MAG: hypothetical protein JXA44_09345 [Methanospirillaceae archaeon]|nr:hypothetical protein [Methanospirillaceae archaeon]